MPSPPRNPGYLGVRLTEEELRSLDALVQQNGWAHRSEGIRQLLRRAAGGPTGSAPSAGVPLEVPVSLARELQREVDDGWARSPEEALANALDRGLAELARLRQERQAQRREVARELERSEKERKEAAREGRRYTGA